MYNVPMSVIILDLVSICARDMSQRQQTKHCLWHVPDMSQACMETRPYGTMLCTMMHNYIVCCVLHHYTIMLCTIPL